MGYHDDASEVTKTALTVFCESQIEYYLQFVTQEMERKRATREMSVGTVLHAMLLEFKKLDEVIGIYPESCLKTDGSINWKPAAQFRADNPDKLGFFKASAAEDIQIVYDAVKDGPIATAIEESSHLEKEFHATLYGCPCKCKPDIAGDVGEYWVCYDLKFMDRIYPGMFSRSARSFRYYLQDAHYSSILTELSGKPTVFKFIAVETQFPFRVKVYSYDQRSREIAHEFHKRKIEQLLECQRTGDWSDKWSGDLILNPWDVDNIGAEDSLDWEDEKVTV